jgi:hypothetical protein
LAQQLNSLDKSITNGRQAILELLGALSLPVYRFVGNSILASEPDVENIRLPVPSVAVDAIAKAQSSQRKRRFANGSARLVVTVGVSPNAIKLFRLVSPFALFASSSLGEVEKASQQIFSTYHLVSAHDCHDTQGFHAVLLRIKVDKALFAALVTKDSIRMNVSIQITNSKLLNQGFKCRLRDSILRGVASIVTVYTGGCSITVDIHVCQLAIDALEVNKALGIAAVGVRFASHVSPCT